MRTDLRIFVDPLISLADNLFQLSDKIALLGTIRYRLELEHNSSLLINKILQTKPPKLLLQHIISLQPQKLTTNPRHLPQNLLTPNLPL